MDFDLSDDQQLLEATTTRFLEDTCPLTEVRALAETEAGFDSGWWQSAAELGWTSMLAPEARGGGSISGAGLSDLALVAFQRGRFVSPGPFAPTNVVIAALGGMAELTAFQEGLLADLIGGAVVAAFAVEEPGRSPYEASLRAEPDGSGFVLHGMKSAVEAASEAEVYLVTALAPSGPVQVLVRPDAPGLSVSRRDSVDLVRRFGALNLEAVVVTEADVVTGCAPSRSLDIANCLQLAETVGAIDRVFEFTMEWAFDRYTFGRPLASYQELKHRFADMKLWLEASKATVWEAVAAVGNAAPDAAEMLSSAKSYVANHSTELVQDCVQMHGGIGVTWEHNIHLYLRRVTVNSATYGTVAEHRERLAAMILQEV
jgi:alkylation response protein AidB-like acyl-CoA dehydrogenase